MKNENKVNQKMRDQKIEVTRLLLDALGCYIEKNETDRRILIASLFDICVIVFTEQTGFDINKQCQEIDAFCNNLKKIAKKNEN